MKLFNIDDDIVELHKKINLLEKQKKHYEDFGKQKEAEAMNIKKEMEKLKEELEEINDLAGDISRLEEDNNHLIEKVTQLKIQLELAEDKIVELTPEIDDVEKKLTNKYPRINQSYRRTEIDGEYLIDVRNFISAYNDPLIPKVSGKDYDEIALNACKWVQSNIKYKSDTSDETYKTSEYWAYPYQTLHHRSGDCEDGAILMAVIMLKSGIPYYRVRLAAGSVFGGGHAYLCYARLKDDEFIVMDWCYWENQEHPSERPTHKEEQNYSDKDRNFYVWFSWDLKYCYGKMETLAESPNKFKTV